MNETPRATVGTWLFNPFVRIAGWQALLIGLAATLLASFIGSFSNTHFDGVLDTHTGLAVPQWVYLIEGLVDWLCLAVVLWIAGRLVSRASFRALDVFGTQALARWPTVLTALVALHPGFLRFSMHLVRQLGGIQQTVPIQPGDGIVFGIVLVVMILVLIWTIALMYRAHRFVCNLTLGKAIATFVVGLVIAEAASKFALIPLYKNLVPAHVQSAGAAAVASPGPARPDYVPQGSEYAKQVKKDFISYTRSDSTPEQVAKLERKVIDQVVNIQPDVSTRQQVLDLFGSPTEIMVRSVQSGEHLTYAYGSVGFYFGPGQTVVHEVRIEKPGPYLYKGKIRVGSTVDELLAVVGAPAETVAGQPIDFTKDRVLFRDVEGKKRSGYIACNSVGARFFLLDDKLCGIYLFKPGSEKK